jgi:hypothetical protein
MEITTLINLCPGIYVVILDSLFLIKELNKYNYFVITDTNAQIYPICNTALTLSKQLDIPIILYVMNTVLIPDGVGQIASSVSKVHGNEIKVFIKKSFVKKAMITRCDHNVLIKDLTLNLEPKYHFT